MRQRQEQLEQDLQGWDAAEPHRLRCLRDAGGEAGLLNTHTHNLAFSLQFKAIKIINSDFWG